MDAYRQYMNCEHQSRDGIPDHFASIPEKLIRKLLFEMRIDVLQEKCFPLDSVISNESLKTFAKNGMTTLMSQNRCSAADDGILEFAFGDLQNRVQARSLTLMSARPSADFIDKVIQIHKNIDFGHDIEVLLMNPLWTPPNDDRYPHVRQCERVANRKILEFPGDMPLAVCYEKSTLFVYRGNGKPSLHFS